MDVKTLNHRRHVVSKQPIQQVSGTGDRTTLTTTSEGLTVLLRETHFAPVVSVQMFVRVGSADETPKTYGAAHLFEHLIFKGTKKRGVGEIAAEVEAAGGNINAYTSFDQTVFYLTVASSMAEKGLDIIADAMINHSIPQDELEKEREVVIEEIRRGRDMASRVSSELLFSTAYQKHPYGRPVIGFEETVRKMTLKEIRGFYKNYYVPKNMILVIVGDFDTDSMLALIKKKVRFQRKSAIIRPRRPIEKLPSTPRFAAKTMPIQECYFNIVFPQPSVHHDDVPSLDALASILGGDETSWLYHACVLEQTLANSVYAQSYTPQDSGVFVVGGTFPQETLLRATDRIAGVLGRILSEAPSSEELQRVKDHLYAERIYEKENVEGVARALGFYQFHFGDLSAEKRYFDRIAELTPEDIVTAAQKYLKPQNFSAVALCPEKMDVSAKLKNHIVNSFKKALAPASVKKAKPARRSRSFADPATEVLQHANGSTRLVHQKLGHLPLCSLRWVRYGGLRYESPTENGISQLLANVWTKGSQRFTSQEILRQMKSFGGSISSFSGKNSFGLGLEVPSKYLRDALNYFQDILVNPRFDDAEFAREKKLQIEDIRTSDDHLSHIVSKSFMRLMYPHHPYGRPVLGEIETLSPLTSSRLRDYFKQSFTADGSVVSMVGDFSLDEFRRSLKEMIEALPRVTSIVAPTISEETLPLNERTLVIEKPAANQAHILLGFRGITHNDPRRHALKVLSSILSGQGGRLFLDLRDQQSLAYSVTSLHSDGLERGTFAVYIACAPEKIGQALAGIRKHFALLRDKNVSADELKRAKSYLVGHKSIEFQYHSTRSMAYALDELYGLGVQETLRSDAMINAVTAADIRSISETLFVPSEEVLAVVCPPAFTSQVS